MNQQTDNMYIDDRYSDEALRKREEIREHISWFREFLTFGTSLPEHIRRRYGLEEDYQRFKKLEIQVHRMPAEPDCRGYGKEQRMKELCEAGRAKGKITLAVEKAYRELDARFCRMTGKKPDADELFGKPAVRQSVPAQKEAPENGARENRMCRRKGRRPGF